MNTYGLILCRSDMGDGGWSLHRPGATDEEIAYGDAPPVMSGPAKYYSGSDRWSRPKQRDYDQAVAGSSAGNSETRRSELIWRPPGLAIGDAHGRLAKSRLFIARSGLIDWLKKQPESVFRLSGQLFEELIADLLIDRGWEVQLMQRTRDGGKDMLAYFDTGISKVLHLVQTKCYKRERRVGVGAVREMHGILHQESASQGMIVTTSSFSADARAMERKYRYQLSLHDYETVVRWIQEHGTWHRGFRES